MAYIFILCPSYSGSTLLWKLISTSNAVSALPSEGQFLPEVKEVMRKDPRNLPWKEIKEVWDGYWDQEKPLLVEKSPSHIYRAMAIVEHFSPVYFLLMVRNPYAHCEGLLRRHKAQARDAAEFAVRSLRQQAENAEKLDNVLCFTYEELVANPESISRKIQSFIPQVGELKYAQKFEIDSIDGKVEREIVDLNMKKIRNLTVNHLKQINSVLKENADIMNYWGYKYYEPSLRHVFAFIRTKMLSKGGRIAGRVTKGPTGRCI